MAVLLGNNLRNKLVGTGAADTINGLGADDLLLGNAGNDTVKGGAGNDTIDGGAGNDKIFGEAGNDKLSGGLGNDTIDGGTGNDTVNGSAGLDTLLGGTENDKLDGGANNDILKGGTGNDTLTGGLGVDSISGGTGIDMAVFAGLSTASSITQVGANLIVTGVNGVDTVASDVEFLRFSDGLFLAATQAFNLTTTNDTFTGGLRNDTFTGIIDTQFAFNTTYSGGDVLDGGGGTGDVLQISITGVGAGATTPPISLSNIEIVRILNQESNFGLSGIDASIWSGVQTIAAQSGISGATTRVHSLGNLVSAEMTNNSSDLQIAYNAGVLAGLADTQALTLSANNGGMFSIFGGNAETLNIVSQVGPNDLALNSGNNHTTINVTGSQRLTLDTQNMSSLITLNAGGMTSGGIEAEGLDSSNGTLAVTGSNATDVFVFGNNSLDFDDVIDGGGSTDILGFAVGGTFVDSDFSGVTGIEVLAGGGGGVLSFALGAEALAAGFTSVKSYDDFTSLTLTVGAAFASALTVDLDAFDAPDLAPTDDGTNTVNGSAMLAAHKLTVQAMTGSIFGDTLSAGLNMGDEIVLTADNNSAYFANVSGFELVTIKGGTGAGAGNDVSIEIGSGAVVADNATLTVNAGGAAGLVNSGARLLFDGSAETGGLGRFDVTGGAGEDEIVGGAGNDILRGGNNNDILTSGVGIDVLQGDAGNDTFAMGASLTQDDTVDGGAGTADELYSSISLTDIAFKNVTNVETLELGLSGLSVELGVEANGGGTGAAGGGFNRVITSLNDTVTVLSGFTNALTVDVSAGGDVTVNATAKTGGTVTIFADAGDINQFDNIDANVAIGGNTVQLVADGGTADIRSFSGFQTVTVLAGTPPTSTAEVTLGGVDTVVASGGTLTVNASALTDPAATFTFDGTGETNGILAVTGGAGNDQITDGGFNDTINGGDGNDTITASTGGDTLNGNAGEDTFKLDAAQLTTADTINGGANTTVTGDVLQLIGSDIIDDVELTNVTGVETLRRTTGGTTTNLGAQAFDGGTGIKRFEGSSGADTLNIGAGYTGAITVDLKTSAGGVDIVNTTTSATVTVEANAGDVTDLDLLTGGTGSGDTLKLYANNDTANLGGVQNFESIIIAVGTAGATGVLINSGAVVADGKTLVVDASAAGITGFAFSGIAETGGQGHFNVTGSIGADNIVGGAGNDTIAAGNGANIVSGLDGNDTITGGIDDDQLFGDGGIDNITGGNGNDDISGGAGNDTINAGAGADDIVVVGNGSLTTISGLLGGAVANGLDTINVGIDADQDRVIFDLDVVPTGISTVSNFDAALAATTEDRISVETGASLAAGWADAGSFSQLNGGAASDQSLIILDNGNIQFGLANAVIAADGLQTGSAIGESYLFAWSDAGGLVHISYATVDNGDTANDQAVDLVTLTGVSLSQLNLADFEFLV